MGLRITSLEILFDLDASDHDFDYFGCFGSRFWLFCSTWTLWITIRSLFGASDHNVRWFLVVLAASDHVLNRFVRSNWTLKQFVRPIFGFEMVCKTDIWL